MNFKSLPQLLDYFKEEKTCIKYYEKIRWNGNPACPHCGSVKPYRTNRGWKCSDKDCAKKFTVKVGTIFENSKISFRIWFGAIYLATAHKKGISSVQLAVDLGITQKTAWFVLHRVREMLKVSAPEKIGFDNAVESDSTYLGGREKNKHKNKQTANHYGNKQEVLGVMERGGKVILKHLKKGEPRNMVDFLDTHLPQGATVYTDEASDYKNLHKRYDHSSINHNARIYVEGSVHTNTIENFWSIFKRGLCGIYHTVSEKHLERYLHEFSSRFNERNSTEQERFEKFLADSEKRLTYKNLIA